MGYCGKITAQHCIGNDSAMMFTVLIACIVNQEKERIRCF